MFPSRISLVTYNLWNNQRWPDREPALRNFAQLVYPDILCVQELCPETQAALDGVLPQHDRVHDDLPSWTKAGNIYWRKDLFTCIKYGAEDIGLGNKKFLFWVRLQEQVSGKTFFVATAHYTWQFNPKERETGYSPRIEQSRKTVTALERLVDESEPAFFMGDLNDAIHPLGVLFDAGYVNCFSALGTLPSPTFPSLPTHGSLSGMPTITAPIDWIVSNDQARPIAAQVPHCYYEDMSPSDHWPVLAVYEI